MPTIKRICAHFDSGERYFEASGKRHCFGEGSGPYEYLLGALSGCFTYTLFDECEGKVSFDSLDISVVGTKRDEIPSLLQETEMVLVVKGCSDERKLVECIERTKAHCSIFQTISKVCNIQVDVEFK